MSEHCGFVVEVKHLRQHTNADRLQIATFFGNDVCVGTNVELGNIGIYFPSDLQLSEEFCEVNNLVRKKDDAGNNIGGYLDPNKRNVTAIRLRGEKSDGIFVDLHSLAYTGIDLNTLSIGDRINIVNGHEICCKYIPRSNARTYSGGNRTRKKKIAVAPLFAEHADTEQLAYNLAAFKPGDEIEITLKMHGTSQRTAYLPVFKGYKKSFKDYLFRREGTPLYDWGYVSGTRRTVLNSYEGGYYGSNEFREQHSKTFEGKLWKGEAVYYEVVGFTQTGVPIMANGDNKKTKDKDFIKQYGDTTVFSYGCSPDGTKTFYGKDEDGHYSIEEEVPQSDIYVYRMTMTTEDGDVVEYTPDFMRYRCEQMGVKCVPVFVRGYIDNEGVCVLQNDNYPYAYVHETDCVGDTVKNIVEQFCDGPDPIGKTHIREGVVIRILNRPKFTAYKHKNFNFKVLENIIKVDAEAPDMEEAEEVNNDNN